jgi:hypothetical protein
MTEIHCFTSASFAYLDRVRVLRETLLAHHPDWTFWLCLPDLEPPGVSFDAKAERIDHLVRVEDLDVPDRQRWIFDHDLVELCTAVKGPMLCRILESGARKVIYLDPDIAIFGDLSDVVTLLDRHDVVVTPHQLEPDSDRIAILDNEIGSLKHGVFNLGFLGVSNTAEGRRFANWWRDRLIEFCFDDIPNGLFTDQRWCDLVPAFFPTTHILRDPGYNFASWNQSRRPMSIGEDGLIRVASRPLRFFHFTKITSVGEVMLERYATNSIAVFEVMKWYREQLAAKAVHGLPAGWWGYGSYTDGTPIPREHRLAYRTTPELRERFPNPFAVGPASLKNFLLQRHRIQPWREAGRRLERLIRPWIKRIFWWARSSRKRL